MPFDAEPKTATSREAQVLDAALAAYDAAALAQWERDGKKDCGSCGGFMLGYKGNSKFAKLMLSRGVGNTIGGVGSTSSAATASPPNTWKSSALAPVPSAMSLRPPGSSRAKPAATWIDRHERPPPHPLQPPEPRELRRRRLQACLFG